MQFRVNLVELSRQIFGIGGISLQQLVDPRQIDYDADIPVNATAEVVGESVLGTPIYESLRVKNPETGDWLEFEDFPALMTVNLEKNIIRNQVNGKAGTVKEYTNTGDYVVMIRGAIVTAQSEDLDYERIDILHQLEKVNEALEVESNLLNTLGINKIVIQNLEHPGGDGFSNVYPFVWNCLSDDDIVLNLDQQSSGTASFDAFDQSERDVFGIYSR